MIEVISESIELKRSEMLELAFQNGFSHPKTVTCSQELDELLNKHRALLNKQAFVLCVDFLSTFKLALNFTYQNLA
ncbi:aspartyl-phosphate phosphatase Spo0E family protein [Bacillus sp. 2205SS5-2]|uniref:aspartyl-phosphate phosphatase Spo0E family protein n=1 Tax=Bacillus sp. 2205SS5-2 TaxID=3109031 RepID=UPI003004ADDF